MECKSCGNVVPDNAKFCPMCGTQVVSPEPEPVEVEAAEVEAAPGGAAEASGAAVTEPQIELVFETEIREPEAKVAEAEAEDEDETTVIDVEVEPAQAAPAEAQPAEAMPRNPYEPVAQDAPAYEPKAQEPEPQPQQPYGAAEQQYQAPPQVPFGAAPHQQAPHQQYQAPQPRPRQAYSKGCIAAGLEDVRSSEGWLKRSMFLGLVSCVPILNFVTAGYALNWAREVPFGGRTELPKQVVTGRNFEYGFYVFLIALVFGLVSGLVGGLIGWIPLLGWLAAVVVALGASMFMALCAFRMVMMQQLGEGFKISAAWQVMKRDWPGLLCAALVPGIVAGIIVSVVLTVVLLVVGLVFAVPIAAVGYMDADGLAALVGVTGVMIFLIVFVIALYASMVVSAIAELVTYRAVAHWVGRNAPEWVAEANQMNYYNIPQY